MRDAMQRQLQEIANDLDTHMVQAPGMAGMMYVEYEPSMIEGPLLIVGHLSDAPASDQRHPTVECCYMVMLHELGHVAHGHTQGRPPYEDKIHYFTNGVLKSEAEAWEFALDNKLPDVALGKTEAYFMATYCLESYMAGAEHWRQRRALNPTTPLARLTNGNRHHHAFEYDDETPYVREVRERLLSYGSN